MATKKQKRRTKTFRIYAEIELKAASQKEARKKFLKLLNDEKLEIDASEQDITEPDIDRPEWKNKYPFQDY